MRNRSGRRRLLPFATIAGTLGLVGLCVTEGLGSVLSNPVTALSDAVLADRPPAVGARAAPADRSPGPVARVTEARALAEQVLARNIFDSSTGPLGWQAPAEPEAPQPSSIAAPVNPDASPARCAAGLRLVASVVNAVHPERSFAALRKDERTELVGLGGRLDELTLFALRPARAYLQSSDGSLCFVPVFLSASERPRVEPEAKASARAEPKSGPKPAADDKSKAKKPPLFSKEELARGVTSLGKAGYAVSRELMLRALKDPGAAAAGAQFRPVERDGHTVGMEIRAVRDGSPLEALGVKSGDVVRSLNGADLSTPVGLLSALKTVRDSDSLSLQIERDGATRSLQYLLD